MTMLTAPYSQEAEEAVLGAILTDGAALLNVSTLISAESFYLVRHGYIFEAMLRIAARNEAIDFATVLAELTATGCAADVGGGAYLLRLVNNTPTSAHVMTYAAIVQRAAVRRRLLNAADQLKALALDEDVELERIGVSAWAALERVGFEGARERSMMGHDSIGEYDSILLARAERRESGELLVIPIPDEWARLGTVIDYVPLGGTVVVSGPSGSGKSAFCEQFTEHAARLGLFVDYIHTEMTTEDVLDRRAARYSGVSMKTLVTGNIGRTESGYYPYDMVTKADGEINKWTDKIGYHWMPDVKFARLQMHLKRAVMMGVRVFVIDHFQDIVPPDANKGANEIRVIEAMIVWLNAFAEKNHILIVIASQLNDAGKVKWSRKLVEKCVLWINIRRQRLGADMAYMLDGIEYMVLKGEDSPETWVEVNKARFGRKAKVPMLYHGPGFRFVDTRDVRTRKLNFPSSAAPIQFPGTEAANDE